MTNDEFKIKKIIGWFYQDMGGGVYKKLDLAALKKQMVNTTH